MPARRRPRPTCRAPPPRSRHRRAARRTGGERPRTATRSLPRSAARVYCVKSFVPIEKKSTSGAKAWAPSAADGTSTMMPTPGCPASARPAELLARARECETASRYSARGDHRKHHARRVPRQPAAPPRSWSRAARCSARAESAHPRNVRLGPPRQVRERLVRTDVERAQDQRPAAQPLRHLLVGGDCSSSEGGCRAPGTGTPSGGDPLPRRRWPRLARRPQATRRWRPRRCGVRLASAPASPRRRAPGAPLARARPAAARSRARAPPAGRRTLRLRRRRGRAIPRAPPAAVPRLRPRPGSRASAPGSRCAPSRCRRRWRCPDQLTVERGGVGRRQVGREDAGLGDRRTASSAAHELCDDLPRDPRQVVGSSAQILVVDR